MIDATRIFRLKDRVLSVALTCLIAAALFPLFSHAQTLPIDMYVDIPEGDTVEQTKARIDELVANAKRSGIRRLIPSLTRADGSVMWYSDRETYDTRRTALRAQGFDALRYLIDRAHANGIEVYPSVITNMGGRIVLEHPQYASKNASGATGGDPQFTTPSLSFAYSQARKARIDQLMDLVNGYAIDGLFLDYARYFEGFGYDQPTLDYLQTAYGFDARQSAVPPSTFPEHAAQAQYTEWRLFATERAKTVTDFVREMRAAIRASGKNVRLGTFADHRKRLYLDTMHLGRDFGSWARNGLVDDVFLGNYETPILGSASDPNNISMRGAVLWARNGSEPVVGVSDMPAGIGSGATLITALPRTFGLFLSSQANYEAAIAEARAGGANRLFVYTGNGMTDADWTMLAKVTGSYVPPQVPTPLTPVPTVPTPRATSSAQRIPSETIPQPVRPVSPTSTSASVFVTSPTLQTDTTVQRQWSLSSLPVATLSTTHGANSPCCAGVFARDLDVGMSGSDVRELQKALNARGFRVSERGAGSPGNETTVFGAATRRALAEFQRANNISPPQGYFGVRTRTFLHGILSGNPTVAPSAHATPAQYAVFARNLELGMRGEDVRALQRLLNARGYVIATQGSGAPGNESAYFGQATQAQLIRFQRDNSITPAVGYFGPKTRALLSAE